MADDVDAFNDRVVRFHVALAEGCVEIAALHVKGLLAELAPSSATSATARRHTSLRGTVSADVASAPKPAEDPRKEVRRLCLRALFGHVWCPLPGPVTDVDVPTRLASAIFPTVAPDPSLRPFVALQMVSFLREKLLKTVLDKLRSFHRPHHGEVDELRPLWRVSASMNDEEGTTLFSEWLGVEFADAGRAVAKAATAAHAVRAMSSTVPPMAPLASPSQAAAAFAVSPSHAGSGPLSGVEQPFIQSLFELLTMASTWMGGVLSEVEVDGERVPNRARSAVVIQLHKYGKGLARVAG